MKNLKIECKIIMKALGNALVPFIIANRSFTMSVVQFGEQKKFHFDINKSNTFICNI